MKTFDISRKSYLDVLRIVACFLVIVNHTNSIVFLNAKAGLTWIASISYFYISKIAVPLFVMISGALLLGIEEKYSSFIKKRILRILLITIVFSLIYFFVQNGKISSFDDVKNLLLSLLREPIIPAYWYLYMIIGLYLVTPFLRKMLKNFDNKDYIIFLSITFLACGVLPMLKIQLSYNFYLSYFVNFIGYYVLGYYLSNKEINKENFGKKKYMFITIFILSISTVVLLNYINYKSTGNNVALFDNALNITTAIPSACFFILIKYYFENHNVSIQVKKAMYNVASLTFGIYLIHILLMEKISFIFSFLSEHTHILIAIVIYELIIFAGCLIIILLLRLIPFIRKYI